jgi:hypothetical protein
MAAVYNGGASHQGPTEEEEETSINLMIISYMLSRAIRISIKA